MNLNQLKKSNDWQRVRAQVLKCGILVSTNLENNFMGYYEGKNYIEKSYIASEEVYKYLGMEWRFTVVNDAFSFDINTRYGKRSISYFAGEVTRVSYRHL